MHEGSRGAGSGLGAWGLRFEVGDGGLWFRV